MTNKSAVGLALGIGAGLLVGVRAIRSIRAIDFAGKTVVIFGGSRGLGLVMAREFAAEGARLVLAARNREELDQAASDLEGRGVHATTIECDICDRGQVRAAIQRVVDEHGTIDVLVNDAGIIQVGPVEHMTVADFEDAMATHFWGPLYAILEALPHMRRAGARRIVNISSIGGKIAVPHLIPYCASKFALTGLSEGLRAELAADGFAVTTVCPGLMRTGSTYNARFKGRHRDEFAWFHISDALPGISIDARRAARQILDATRRGDPELIITLQARLAVALNGVLPGVVAGAMAIADWLLPAATGADGDTSRSGWQSVSSVAPSAITRLADRATLSNNEVPTADGGGR